MSADPLTYHGNTRARNAAEFLRVTENITSSMASMDFRFVVFHGDLDTLCDPGGSRQLFEKSAVRALVEIPLHVMPCDDPCRILPLFLVMDYERVYLIAL